MSGGEALHRLGFVPRGRGVWSCRREDFYLTVKQEGACWFFEARSAWVVDSKPAVTVRVPLASPTDHGAWDSLSVALERLQNVVFSAMESSRNNV